LRAAVSGPFSYHFRILRTTSVAPVELPLPRAGLAAAATWLASLSERGVAAGAAYDLVPRIPAGMPSYASTTSVAALDLPVVRLHHHVLSWLPGTTFIVAHDGQPRVGSGSLEPARPLPRGPVGLVTAGDAALAGSLERVLHGLDVRERLELRDDDAATSPWRRARAYEVCVVPDDVDAFSVGDGPAVTGERPRCPQCGEPTFSACPFCRAREGVLA
jgi:hypothetical protein